MVMIEHFKFGYSLLLFSGIAGDDV